MRCFITAKQNAVHYFVYEQNEIVINLYSD